MANGRDDKGGVSVNLIEEGDDVKGMCKCEEVWAADDVMAVIGPGGRQMTKAHCRIAKTVRSSLGISLAKNQRTQSNWSGAGCTRTTITRQSDEDDAQDDEDDEEEEDDGREKGAGAGGAELRRQKNDGAFGRLFNCVRTSTSGRIRSLSNSL